MALTSAFFDAELVGGEYDRVYSAERFAEYFASFIANGVFPDPATNLQVVANIPSDMTVQVKSGLGWINGYYCNNDENYPLTISPANGTLPRVDAVVLRWSRSNRSISLEVKTGVATSSPSAPSLERSADNYELMLASIEVVAGATSIAQANITDKRPDSSVCGWVAGVVNQIDTTDLFAQYDAAFKKWFENVQSQLEGDVVTNLLNSINQVDQKVDSNWTKTLNSINQVDQKVDSNWTKTLSDTTKGLFGLNKNAVPDTVFSKIYSLITANTNLANTKAKIASGSYNGTGTYGNGNPNRLTFGFEPKFVFISMNRPGINNNRFKPYSWCSIVSTGYMYNDYFASSSSSTEYMFCKITRSGNTISWYNKVSEINQGNYTGITYHYIAIG